MNIYVPPLPTAGWWLLSLGFIGWVRYRAFTSTHELTRLSLKERLTYLRLEQLIEQRLKIMEELDWIMEWIRAFERSRPPLGRPMNRALRQLDHYGHKICLLHFRFRVASEQYNMLAKSIPRCVCSPQMTPLGKDVLPRQVPLDRLSEKDKAKQNARR